MTIYALEKNAAGAVIGLASWGDDTTALPSGFSTCTETEYASAKSTFMNSIKDQAIGVMAQIQATAALTVAMGETFGTEMRAYVTAVQAIAEGTDTTSTSLPAAPSAATS